MMDVNERKGPLGARGRASARAHWAGGGHEHGLLASIGLEVVELQPVEHLGGRGVGRRSLVLRWWYAWMLSSGETGEVGAVGSSRVDA
jgi:hypothetical protein